MTSRETFAPEEWETLLTLPRAAAIAAAIADPGGAVGATKAIVAAFKTLVTGAAEYPDNALITALLLELRTGTEGPEDQGETLDLDEDERIRRLTATLAHARAANVVLDERVDPVQADEYRYWIVAIARKAVRAAASGGFLGIGAEQVTEEEAAFVADLRDAIGLAS